MRHVEANNQGFRVRPCDGSPNRSEYEFPVTQAELDEIWREHSTRLACITQTNIPKRFLVKIWGPNPGTPDALIDDLKERSTGRSYLFTGL